MKARRIFHPQKALADALAGRLKGAALRKAVALAKEFGNSEAAKQLKLCDIEASSFASDAAPRYLRERVAQGIRALAALGEPCKPTKRMMRRHGVIETIERTVPHPSAAENFQKLSAAGFKYLSAESVVLNCPHLFHPKVVEVARSRLGR